jgi:hypothetical protein
VVVISSRLVLFGLVASRRIGCRSRRPALICIEGVEVANLGIAGGARAARVVSAPDRRGGRRWGGRWYSLIVWGDRRSCRRRRRRLGHVRGVGRRGRWSARR